MPHTATTFEPQTTERFRLPASHPAPSHTGCLGEFPVYAYIPRVEWLLLKAPTLHWNRTSVFFLATISLPGNGAFAVVRVIHWGKRCYRSAARGQFGLTPCKSPQPPDHLWGSRKSTRIASWSFTPAPSLLPQLILILCVPVRNSRSEKPRVAVSV